MARAMSGVELVFHAAAMKHVPPASSTRSRPPRRTSAGRRTWSRRRSTLGSTGCSPSAPTRRSIPTNVMGATKLLAERLMARRRVYKGPARTRFASVRFGNVIGSRGSIVPLILAPGRRGRPGHGHRSGDDALPHAASAMPVAAVPRRPWSACEGGEVFILKMPRVRVGDLVEVLDRGLRAAVRVTGPRRSRSSASACAGREGRRGADDARRGRGARGSSERCGSSLASSRPTSARVPRRARHRPTSSAGRTFATCSTALAGSRRSRSRSSHESSAIRNRPARDRAGTIRPS